MIRCLFAFKGLILLTGKRGQIFVIDNLDIICL